jgi:hypothetical protein
MAAFQPSRYKGVAIVVVALVLGLSIADRMGASTFGPRADALVPSMHIDWARFNTFAGRVAAVKRQQVTAPTTFPTRWGVVLGHSSAEQDVDPVLVKQHTGGMDWLVLAGSGGSSGIENLDFHFALLEKAGLRPHTVVLAMHPFLFAVALPEPPPKMDFARALRSSSRTDLVEAARLASWLGSTQLLFGEFVRRGARASRDALADFAGWPEWANYPVEKSPWESNFTNATGNQERGRFLQRVERFAALGRFNPENYTDAPARPVERLLARIDALGAKAIVVAMPEHSAYRARMPAIGMKRLESAFPAAVPRFDLRDALPDEAFWDPIHANTEGKRQFSVILARKLEQVETLAR